MEVRPDAVVGHSSGEIVAAYAAGFISMSASITIAYYRGDAMKSIDKEGAMAAIGLRPSIVGSFLTPGVEIACENSASSTTISGDSQKVVQVMEKIEKEYSGALVLLLQVPVAYHSGKFHWLCTAFLRWKLCRNKDIEVKEAKLY